MIWLLGAPSLEALPSVMHHRQQILQDWVIAAAFVEVAAAAALSPVVSLPCCQGSPCWASWEHTVCRKNIPLRSCSLCQASTVSTKAHRGDPWKKMNDKNPKTWLTYTAREFSVIACCLLATDKRTQGHTRGICFNEKNCVPSKKRDRIIKLDRGILWS